jgi:hypothetical protein
MRRPWLESDCNKTAVTNSINNLMFRVLLFTVSAVWCSSTNYYGWTPNKELIFRFESQVLTGIPEIRDSQFAGLRLASDVRVQAFSDFSLRIKVSISQTFFVQLFVQKCSEQLYSPLKVCICIFWQKDIGKKAAHKMLVKLTKGINFTNF